MVRVRCLASALEAPIVCSGLGSPESRRGLHSLGSFNVGVVLAAQSVEGLHDDESERARLLNTASTLIAHRLADPDPIVTGAGTVRRAERSHQLDPTGATGMGSLRIQDAYRVDPNEVRYLLAGVAYVVCAGRAAKVAVARAPAGTGPAPAPEEPVVPADRDDGVAVSSPDPEEPITDASMVADDEDASGGAAHDVPSRGERRRTPRVCDPAPRRGRPADSERL